MKSIDVSARTIEEAVSEGLAKLGCSISDCKVEILQEGAKGLFGLFGSKPAAVRLTLLAQAGEDEAGIDFDLSGALDVEAERPGRTRPAEPGERKPRRPAPERKPERAKERPAQAGSEKKNEVLERFKSAPLPNNGGKPAQEDRRPPARAPKQPRQRAPREASFDEHELAPARVPVPAPAHIDTHDLDTPQGVAQAFLLDVTQRMGVDVKVDVRTGDEGNLLATMYGDTLGILIGRRGETLDALQYLTSLMVNRGREEYVRVTLDTENYRAKREEALTRLAARMASRAVKTGRKVALEPMNPYERRILHASLQNNPNVSTHSEGDEPYRHVVVVPEK